MQAVRTGKVTTKLKQDDTQRQPALVQTLLDLRQQH